MSQRKNILANISAGFITSTAIDTGLYVAMNAPKYNFHLTNKDFQCDFKQKFKNIVRDNAVSNVTYYATIEALQKTVNKNDEFNKRLYIRMGSSVLSTLAVEVGFYREKKYWILASAALSASTEFAYTLYSDWQLGGREYAQTNFPAIYNLCANSQLAQIYQKSKQPQDQTQNQGQDQN